MPPVVADVLAEADPGRRGRRPSRAPGRGADGHCARSDLASIVARIAADKVVHLGAKVTPRKCRGAASRAERQAASMPRCWRKCRPRTRWRRPRNTRRRQQISAAGEATRPRREGPERRLPHGPRQATRPTYTPLSPIYPRPSTGRRPALARWITDRDNPLTARVAVNHIWRWHFGRPLVATTFDFGRNGKPPTHPELLDWLAVELMEPKRLAVMKPLHRLIVTSDAYRMRSRIGGRDDRRT